MGNDHRVFSSIFSDHNVVQQVAISQPKSLIIDTLRELFRGGSEYPYVSDSFGFPILPDDPSIPLGEDGSTAIIITDVYRYETKMFPAITIGHAGGRYQPISFNQNDGTVLYEFNCFLDNNGVPKFTRVPKAHVFAGAWNMNFDINIVAEDITTLEELVDIVSLGLQNIKRKELWEHGLFIKNVAPGGEATEDYANDFIYKQKLTVETYSEWRREIPIANLIETILFSIGVQHFGGINFPPKDKFLVHLGGRNLVNNGLDIIAIAGNREGLSTDSLELTATEQEILNNL